MTHNMLDKVDTKRLLIVVIKKIKFCFPPFVITYCNNDILPLGELTLIIFSEEP